MKTQCSCCPRRCAVDRFRGETGFCGAGNTARIAKWMIHMWEEPCISGFSPAQNSVSLPLPGAGEDFSSVLARLQQTQYPRGSGAIFFSGCNLRCAYCQNRDISRDCAAGVSCTAPMLAEMFLCLQAVGAYNCNLVTPTPHLHTVREAILLAKAQGLSIPVVWNTGGYELPEAIDALDGLVDIYLTDWKYMDGALARRLSNAEDYADWTARAYPRMFASVGTPVYDAAGMMRRGVILRHLILPGFRADSMAVLRRAAELVPPQRVVLSLMRQYTPDFCTETDAERIPRSLHRRVTSFEYESTLACALALGYNGYRQERDSASAGYTPDFL